MNDSMIGGGYLSEESMISFEVIGQPLPKRRPRVINGRAHTPIETKVWEQQVAWAARLAMRECEPLTCPIILELRFFRQGKRLADLDNLVKACKDAANGILWIDDSQVRTMFAQVVYDADYPHVEVSLWERGEQK